MIPYIHVPDLKLGPLTLHPFGLLVATGVIIGTWLATKRAKQRRLDLDKLNSFITWMLVAGFLGGHMLDQIFYHWPEFVKRPWSIFLLWEGLSSFGGFIGGLIGVLLWKYFESVPVLRTPLFTLSTVKRRETPMPIMPFCDLILSVFPVAWIFGRSGCSVVHDHPGHARAAGLLARGRVRAGRPDETHPFGADRVPPWNDAALRPRSPRDDVHDHPRDDVRVDVAPKADHRFIHCRRRIGLRTGAFRDGLPPYPGHGKRGPSLRPPDAGAVVVCQRSFALVS